MASNINYISIDATYPIAGQDNDSQGFRDNYTVIKNNFQVAQGEITDLQLNTARLDQGNVNFNNNTISYVNLSIFTQGVYNGGLVSSSPLLVDYRSGPYQIFNISNDVIFNISGFPNLTNLSKLTMELTADDTLRNVTFSFAGSTAVKYSGRWYSKTVGTVSNVLGSGPWTATISGLISTTGFSVGQTITAVSETGSIGTGTVTVTGIPTSSSITIQVAAGGTTPVPGIVSSITSSSTTIPVISSVNPVIFEFWTHDGGNTFYADYRGQYT